MTTNETARLLLLAAVCLLRDGDVDNYTVARLAAAGYTRQQVESAARWLAEDAALFAEIQRE